MRNLKGFTFVELIIVMALIVTFAGLATAQFAESYMGRSSEYFVKELTSYVRFLQFKAIEEGRVHKLKVDQDNHMLVSLVQGDRAKDFYEIKTPFSKRFSNLDRFVVHLNKGNDIYFFPDGSITKNKFIVMHKRRKEATIEIKNRIGALQVTRHGT